MKTNNIELKQKKVIKFVKNYFSNNNSPLIKKNYFALYEDGEGKKKIQEKDEAAYNFEKINKNVLNFVVNLDIVTFITITFVTVAGFCIP